MMEQKHGQYNSVMLKENRKTIVLITTHRLADSNTKIVKSSNDQCEKDTGNVKGTSKIGEV